MSVHKGFHPYGWFKDHMQLRSETTEIVLGFLILWIGLIFVSYLMTLLVYWALTAMDLIEEGLFSALNG